MGGSEGGEDRNGRKNMLNSVYATGGIVTHGGTLGARNRGAVLVSGCGAK